jgi:tRNA pseudouridine13 synthase
VNLSSLIQWAYLNGEPNNQGVLRQCPEDFFVDEVLGFDADGEGQHRLLHIQKRNTNSEWLARQIAKLAGVANKEVGFAGLKDRHAVTRQWFSVDLAGRPEPDWQQLVSDDIQLLEAIPHGRKLRRGSLKGNRFRITIHDLQGDSEALEARLQQIKQAGVPNYFMEQRFGRDFANLEHALAMFRGRKVKNRQQRSLYLSAARSLVFNQILSQRIQQGLWNQVLSGDVMMLHGSHSVFVVDELDVDITNRLKLQDIHLTGAMWGRGTLQSQAEARAFEQQAVSELAEWCQGLEQAGLKQERRALRLIPEGLQWDIHGDQITLEFFLPAGSYATAVMHEVVRS